MEVAAPFCFNLKMYTRRKKYKRLIRRIVSDEENEKKGSWKNKAKIPEEIILGMTPLRKCRDAYMKTMIYLAERVQQLNNDKVYLFKKVPKAQPF